MICTGFILILYLFTPILDFPSDFIPMLSHFIFILSVAGQPGQPAQPDYSAAWAAYYQQLYQQQAAAAAAAAASGQTPGKISYFIYLENFTFNAQHPP